MFATRHLIVINRQICQRCSMSTAVPVDIPKKSYELVIVGGGAAGISIAARFVRYFRAMKMPSNSIAVIEPNDTHYYQPYWTLVGAGKKDISQSSRPMSSVMPKGVDWIKETCSDFEPESNNVILSGATGTINYKYLVLAAGIQIDWDKVDGLLPALEQPDSVVCSNYSEKYSPKTWQIMQQFKGGNAIFTMPNTPIKCAGAPQKIMYLTDAYLRQKNLRDKTYIHYFTSIPDMFASKHYANALRKLCKQHDLNYTLRHNLVRIDNDKRIAYFENLDKPQDQLLEIKFDMLHVAPPMSAPKFLKALSTDTSNGFVAVDSKTLQHVKYENIFALGDCSSLPTSKTAAAVASQNRILAKNLLQFMQHKAKPYDDGIKIQFNELYNGYTSCPIVTGNNRCIMAEFDYKHEPIETFPIDQSKERRTMYIMKRDIFPFVYWNMMLKGYWGGPSMFRSLFHFGLK